MSNYYNLDGIKTELEKRLSYEKSILKAWENVTFPTKKDGTPFKVMSKNFDGAKLYLDNFAWRDYEKRLKVNIFDDLNGYISEDINCYNQVKYISDKSKLEKVSNIMPKEPMLEQVYVYDLDDIKEEIQKTINRHKENIVSLEKQIDQAEKAYNNFVADYKKAIENLVETCGANDNSLFYAVRDTVKERYPYC
jgi:hypothetical protein|nr:MAG TPA: hypothetical protein [Caudoviricetes sp.]